MTDESFTKLVDAIQKMSFATYFTDEDYNRFRKIFKERSFKKNQKILWLGQKGLFFFVIGTGKISVRIKGEDFTEKTIAYLDPGQYVGEIALLYNRPRVADCYAEEDNTLLFFLDQRNFFDHFAAKPEVKRVMEEIAESRLAETKTIIEEKGDEQPAASAEALRSPVPGERATDQSGAALVQANHEPGVIEEASTEALRVKTAPISDKDLSLFEETLKKSGFLTTGEELQQIVAHSEEVELTPGAVFELRKDGNSLFAIVAKGEVAIKSLDHRGIEIPSGTLGEGEYYGEIPFMFGLPLLSKCYAEKTSLLFVTGNLQGIVTPLHGFRNALEARALIRIFREGLSFLSLNPIFEKALKEQFRRFRVEFPDSQG